MRIDNRELVAPNLRGQWTICFRYDPLTAEEWDEMLGYLRQMQKEGEDTLLVTDRQIAPNQLGVAVRYLSAQWHQQFLLYLTPIGCVRTMEDGDIPGFAIGWNKGPPIPHPNERKNKHEYIAILCILRACMGSKLHAIAFGEISEEEIREGFAEVVRVFPQFAPILSMAWLLSDEHKINYANPELQKYVDWRRDMRQLALAGRGDGSHKDSALTFAANYITLGVERSLRGDMERYATVARPRGTEGPEPRIIGPSELRNVPLGPGQDNLTIRQESQRYGSVVKSLCTVM